MYFTIAVAVAAGVGGDAVIAQRAPLQDVDVQRAGVEGGIGEEVVARGADGDLWGEWRFSVLKRGVGERWG